MKSSNEINEIAAALNRAQAKIGAAVKGSKNPFFKSSYADLGDVIKAFKEPMLEEGLSYIQHPVSNERGVGVSTRLMHNSGQWLENEFTVATKADPQGAGSAITYCRRYALAAVFGIPQVDDDANASTFIKETPISADEAATINALAEEVGADMAGFLKFMKASKVEDITDYDRAIGALEKKRAA